ncbi:MAG: hypothetical protein IK955_03450 [Clostridia bacterium]|nr:hypothetical protein [Clostridia bacterium]
MNPFIVLFIIFVIAFVAFMIFCLIMYTRQCKRNKLQKGKVAPEGPELKDAFESVKIHATVVDLFCLTEMIGIKTPRTQETFIVTFKTDNNEQIKVNIPQEMYDGLEIGQYGEVTLIEGELYSFIVRNELKWLQD